MLLDFRLARAYIPRPTIRAVLMIALGIAVSLVGVLQNSTPLTRLGAGILLAVIMYLSYQGLKESALYRVQVEREIIGEPVEGRELRVLLKIRNPTPIGFDLVTLTDTPPPLWDTKGHATVTAIPPLSTVTLEYRAKPVLGKHSFGPVHLSYRDMLGFTRIMARKEVETVVAVSPKPLDRPKRSLVPPRAQLPPGIARLLRMRGQGSQFLELREYTSDDDVRLIDWKASARAGKLMVKIMEREVTSYVIVYLLLTPTMFQGVIGETKAEYAARLAASIADYLSRRGDSYAIIVSPAQGGRGLATSWFRGRNSSIQAMRHLAETIIWPSTRGRWATKSVSGFREDIMRIHQRRKIMLFLITDFWESAAEATFYAEELNRLRSVGIVPIVVIPVTVAFEASRLGPSAPLYRLLSLERIERYQKMRKSFQRYGIPSLIAGPRDILEIIISRIEATIG